MELIGYIATSLDGFIARKDGALDWLEKEDYLDPAGGDYGWKKHLNSLDAMIMGKNTFLKIIEIGEWVYGDLEVFVASHSLKKEAIPSSFKDKVQIIRGSSQDLVSEMKKRGKKRVYIDGGKLLQSFMEEHLLSELTLTRIPVIIGSGIPLFGALPEDVFVKHLKTESFGSGVTQSLYSFSS